MIRVLIVDNNRLSGDIFSAILEEQPDIEVVGRAKSISEAQMNLRLADVVLLSTTLPEDEAYRLTRLIYKGGYQARVLILGQSETNKMIIRYLEAGAHGYISREDSVEAYFHTIRSIFRGKAILSPDLVSDLISRFTELSSSLEGFLPFQSKIACLTPREREILKLIGRDYTNQDIAKTLIIEVGTVKNHVHNILSKLNVNSRREAAGYLPAVYASRQSDRILDFTKHFSKPEQVIKT
jgi:DNA-binding NarL/FixJ family response regulator